MLRVLEISTDSKNTILEIVCTIIGGGGFLSL